MIQSKIRCKAEKGAAKTFVEEKIPGISDQ